jgi:polyhydroxyalkanoate synthesis regulator phasin
MNMKQKWMAVASTAAVAAGVLMGGMAMASASGTAAANTPAASSHQVGRKGLIFSPEQLKAQLDQQVKDGKLTQGQEDVMLQLDSLRQEAMTKLQADEKAIIDQAVQSGKITRDEATQLQQHGHGPGGPAGGRGGRGDHGPGGGRGHGMGPNMTADQLKAQLDQDVKDGKLTQDKADQILKDVTEHQADHAAQQNQAPAQP